MNPITKNRLHFRHGPYPAHDIGKILASYNRSKYKVIRHWHSTKRFPVLMHHAM